MVEKSQAVSPALIFARPAADALWLGPTVESALGQLSKADPVRVLCGPPSSGRTILLRALKHMLEPGAMVLPLTAPLDSPAALLSTLLTEAGLAPWELNEIDQRNLLTVIIQQRRAQGLRVVITIDDAEKLTPECWAELERLAALRIDEQPALELVVATLASDSSAGPPLRKQLNSIVANGTRLLVHVLAWLNPQEVQDYIDWRLAQHNQNGLISETAMHLIARYTGGRFRAIDLLCQLALLERKQHADAERVDVTIVEEATRKLKQHVTPLPGAALLHNGQSSGYVLVSREHQVLASYDLQDKTLLGRSELNDICLLSPYVSRHHAAILRTGQGFYVANLNSANGIRLNGQFIEGAPLFDKDVLGIGDYRVKIELTSNLTDSAAGPPSHGVDDTVEMHTSAMSALPLRVVK
jgi:type II secretory pathway predicted ATPase ExeA